MSDEYIDTLRKTYIQQQECTELPGEDFSTLAIEILDKSLPCTSAGHCEGKFTAPNRIQILGPWIAHHEFNHYLLFYNTGDLDPGHLDPIWSSCN